MTRNKVVKGAIDPDVFAIASKTELGGIKVGQNLTIEEDGTLNASGGKVPDATLTDKGIVQLSSATDSTSEVLAATPNAVKKALDTAVKVADKGKANGVASLGADGKVPAAQITAQDPTNYDGNTSRQSIFVGPGQQFTTIQAALNSLKKVNAGERELILSTGAVFNENVNIKDFHGGTITIRGNGQVTLNGNIDISNCTADMSLQYITLGASANMLNAQSSNHVYFYQIRKTVSGSSAIWCGKGRYSFSNCMFSNQAVDALSFFSGAYAALSGVTGTGNGTGISCRESIVFKDSGSTIAGATHKSNGGQIFSTP